MQSEENLQKIYDFIGKHLLKRTYNKCGKEVKLRLCKQNKIRCKDKKFGVERSLFSNTAFERRKIIRLLILKV
ncbi:hypothetical protein AAJ76_850004410 [Vairimorpha ceranae]|uniref:Uncharacterized protein n=1 Tax=Vairimorpha ceranae TaxID=40302 RepID=A0A0F9Z8X8_9MICR|nr:hypothetical protein AAJ76_850004410 [Vairimorpha ceranae]KKO74304.1 hypothetical protein AAJ76_850004410 [Vairimorpha ceranae]